MKCLACWEDIEEGEKICHHCGSVQEDVKDFLTLALLSQQKKKITAEKSPILEYVMKVDPSLNEDVTISSAASVSTQEQPVGRRQESYSPSRPNWLGAPATTQPQPDVTPATTTPAATPATTSSKTEKTIKCPECERDVPVRKFCKYCGTQLQKPCSKCEKLNSYKARFCTSCGETFETEN